jgi:hypothetical protein
LFPRFAVMTSITRVRLKSKAIPREIDTSEGTVMDAALGTK